MLFKKVIVCFLAPACLCGVSSITYVQGREQRRASMLDNLSLPSTSSLAISKTSATQSAAFTPFTWTGQGVRLSFPSGGEMLYEKPSGFRWHILDKSAGAADALLDAVWFGGVVTISNKQEMFQGMTFKDALDYEYNEGLAEQRQGKYTEVRWLTIDGVNGIFSREARMKDSRDLRHIKWKCYRVYRGEHQLLEFSAYTSNRAFDRRANVMQKIVESLKFSQ